LESEAELNTRTSWIKILPRETVVLVVQVRSSQVVILRKVGVASCVVGRILRKTVLKILVFRLPEGLQHLDAKVKRRPDGALGSRGVIRGIKFGGTSEIVGLLIGIDRGA